ncbi:hypothetical protein [Fulvivirga lutea]|uniref:MG2 domain-containing protein n=1 Tax=Fulvivirga lutea TaxID=2810512 RepID=A0A975A1K1_9BACT|nr:hypothetical protein [Fulvivirga lutea]QSE97901.1 hypothetical protein JR347_02100 [Fulvivirga lutea]
MKKLLSILLVIATNFALAQTPASKITFDVDKPFYFNSQEIQISYQLLDYENKPSQSNELVYILLKNKFNDVVELQKNFASKGQGSSKITLTKSMASGYYELIVYTNYLLGLGESQLNRQRILIYDTEESFTIKDTKKLSHINFYPEGGQLIDNIPTRLAYSYEHNCSQTSAKVVDDKEKTIAELELTKKSGYGSVFLKPESSRAYKISHFCDSSNNIKSTFPKVVSEGLSLRVDDRQDYYLLILQSNGSVYHNDSLIIRPYSQNNIVYESKALYKRKGLAIRIEKNQLPSSLLSFNILHNENIIASRSVFNNVNLKNEQILIDSVLQTSSGDELVFNTNRDIQHLNAKIIPSNWVSNNKDLYYLSNLPVTLFSSPDDIRQRLDDYAISISESTTIKASENASRTKENYLYLRGNLKDIKPLPDSSQLYLFIPGVNVVYQANLDSSGYFEFPLLVEFYGKQKIPFYAYSEDHKFTNPEVKVEEVIPSISLNLTEELPWTEAHDAERKNIAQNNSIQKVYKFYQPEETTDEKTLEFNIKELVRDPDSDYDMTRYKVFPTMTDVIKEVLNGLMLRKKKGQYTLRMFSEDQLRVYKEAPFVFINNRPTKDIDEILAINPADIQRIQIFNRQQKLVNLGPFGDGGLVVVTLKESAGSNEIAQSGNYFEATGVTKPASNPIKNNEHNPNLPDMRSVLLWESNLSFPDGKVRIPFRTSDRPGNYTIFIKYMDGNGQLGFGIKEFKTVFNPKKLSSARKE